MGNVVTEFVGTAKQLLRIVAKRRWLALGVAIAVAALCAVGVVLVPSRYEAKAQMYVDTQSVLKPMMAGLTYQPDIDMQVRMLARTLVSRPNVEKLVRNPALGLDTTDVAAREKLVTRLMEQIKVTPACDDQPLRHQLSGREPGDGAAPGPGHGADVRRRQPG